MRNAIYKLYLTWLLFVLRATITHMTISGKDHLQTKLQQQFYMSDIIILRLISIISLKKAGSSRVSATVLSCEVVCVIMYHLEGPYRGSYNYILRTSGVYNNMDT